MTCRRIRHAAAGLFLLAACLPAAVEDTALPVAASLDTRRTTVYVGETFDLKLTLHTQGPPLGKLAALDRLPAQDKLHLGSFRELPGESVLKGRTVTQTRRYRSRARAVAAGALHLEPVLDVKVLMSKDPTTRSEIWKDVKVRVRPLDLMVLPLPDAGRPDDYSGAVGAFDFDVRCSPRRVAPGDLVTLAMSITGSGFLGELDAPRAGPNPDIKTYTPRRVDDFSPAAAAFEQIVIPCSTNVTAIPPVSFTFFHPDKSRYETLVRGPFPLHCVARRPVRGDGSRVSAPRPCRAPSAAWACMIAAAGLAFLAWAWRLCRRSQTRWSAVLLSLAIALLLGGVGGFASRATQARPAAFTAERVIARLAPAHRAAPLFDVPAGTRLCRLSSQKGWVRVSCDAGTGWVPNRVLSCPRGTGYPGPETEPGR